MQKEFSEMFNETSQETLLILVHAVARVANKEIRK